MATLNANSNHTLIELVNRLDPTGRLGSVAEVLSQINEFIPDVYWLEGNDKTSHVSFQRSSEPSPTIRRIGLGVAASKSNIQPIRDIIMLNEGWSVVDERMIGLTGDIQGYRYQEDMSFLMGFEKSIVGYFIYGSNADEEMNGFSTRRSSIGTYTLNASGTGSDLTSLYIAAWGPDLFGIYPTGSVVGFDYVDWSQDPDVDSSSRHMVNYKTQYKWDCGLGLRDNRALYRIANVDTSNIATLAESSLPVIDDLIIYARRKARSRMGMGSEIIYGNSDAMIIFDRLAKDKTNVNYYGDAPFGGSQDNFQRVMLHQVDQILSTETALS